MRFAPPVELDIGVPHRLRTAAAEHDLEVDRLHALVLIAVDDPGRTGDAFPWPEGAGHPPPFLEHFPVAPPIAEATDAALGDLLERKGGDLGRRCVAGFGHRDPLEYSSYKQTQYTPSSGQKSWNVRGRRRPWLPRAAITN